MFCKWLYFIHFYCQVTFSWLTGKDSDDGRDWEQVEKGTTEDEMAGWHHQLDGLEFEGTPGVGDGQGGLVCCSSWGRRVGHDWVTELNWLMRLWTLSNSILAGYLWHYPIRRGRSFPLLLDVNGGFSFLWDSPCSHRRVGVNVWAQ